MQIDFSDCPETMGSSIVDALRERGVSDDHLVDMIPSFFGKIKDREDRKSVIVSCSGIHNQLTAKDDKATRTSG